MNQLDGRRADGRDTDSQRAPFFVLLGSLLLYFLRFGYDYAASDQDEIVPYLLHRLDPGLLTQDWLVGVQMGEFSVRTYVVWLLNAFSLILPVWLSVLLVYAASWLFLAAAVYKLTYHFTKDELAACAAVVFGLVLTPLWTLGGNDLAHSMLVPSMVGWTLGLWAFYHFLRSRYLVSPVLLGAACWMQPLVGLHLAMLLFLLRVWKVALDREPVETVGGTMAWGVFFVLWASPALGPIMHQQLMAPAGGVRSDPSVFYIFAEFRLPHHYLPGSFSLHSAVRFAGLGLAALGALLWGSYRRRLHDTATIVRLLVLVSLFCLIGTTFTEQVPMLSVAKLQFFKMTVLAKLLFVIVVTGAVFHALPDRLHRLLLSVTARRLWGLAAAAAVWVAAVSVTLDPDGPLHDRVGPFRRSQEPIGRVQAWARSHTNSDAVFAVPPSLSSFRSEAHRPIVINFKAIPYTDEQIVTWFDRLIDMAPIRLPRRGGAEIMDDLDAAFESLSARRLTALSTEYDIDYVLRTTPLADPGRVFEPAFRSEGWFVYRRTAIGGSFRDSVLRRGQTAEGWSHNRRVDPRSFGSFSPAHGLSPQAAASE